VYVLRQNCRAAGWRWDTRIIIPQFSRLNHKAPITHKLSVRAWKRSGPQGLLFQVKIQFGFHTFHTFISGCVIKVAKLKHFAGIGHPCCAPRERGLQNAGPQRRSWCKLNPSSLAQSSGILIFSLSLWYLTSVVRFALK
jgi:hypothetical protein